MAVRLAVASDVFDGNLFCAILFHHQLSWMRFGTALSQFGEVSYLILHIRAVAFVLCGDPKILLVYSFNALILPVLRDCFPTIFSIFSVRFIGGFRFGVWSVLVILVRR